MRLGPQTQSAADIGAVFRTNLDSVKEKVVKLCRTRKVPVVVQHIKAAIPGFRTEEERTCRFNRWVNGFWVYVTAKPQFFGHLQLIMINKWWS